MNGLRSKLPRGRPRREIPRRKIGLSINVSTAQMLDQMSMYSNINKSKIIDILIEKEYINFIKKYELKDDEIIEGVIHAKNI